MPLLPIIAGNTTIKSMVDLPIAISLLSFAVDIIHIINVLFDKISDKTVNFKLLPTKHGTQIKRNLLVNVSGVIL